MAKTLGDLKPGEAGYVKRIGTKQPQTRRRLIDMGITPMTRIEVRKVAPLGDPIEIHLRGYELSLRRDDALQITLLDAQEEQIQLQREAQTVRNLQQHANETLKTHDHTSDQLAHERALRLTDWIIRSTSPMEEGCSNVCPDCQACKRRKKAAHTKPVDSAAGSCCSRDDNQPMKLALVGNPNCGKTTLFNAITGAKEYVGNWAGVTVEKKEGKLHAFGHDITLVDLPGIYSLSPYSMEEVIARNFIIEEQPDAIINIVDGTNLERNLYLTIQLMELERPMIIALNMMDQVEKQGDHIDVRKLSVELGIPVVPISAKTGDGIGELLRQSDRLIALAHQQMHCGFHIEPDDLYDALTHSAHHRIGEIIGDAPGKVHLPKHWAEIKLLEGDQLVREKLQLSRVQQQALDRVIANYTGENSLNDNETRVANSRYRYIERVIALSLRKKAHSGATSISERIDRILTNKYLAIPIFLLFMMVIFLLTFDTLGAFLSDQMDVLINVTFSDWLRGGLTSLHTADWLVSLVCDGIVKGVGGVLTFLPQLALLFFFLSLLEDSGYMARTAFIMDKLLQRFGLSGRSFIPLLMGFGCTVPAVMAARTMDNEKTKRMTIMLLPFMSCSAKLPVYGLIASAFFAENRFLVVFSLYVLGILVGIVSGILFKHTVCRENNSPFVMELPPYRLPALHNTFAHVWERVKHFLEKAGTLILAMSIVLWLLQTFNYRFEMVENPARSMLGTLGSAIAPIFTPLGFGTWQAAVALLSGLVAKEMVASSLSLFYGFSAAAGATAIRASLGATFTPLSAYAFLCFIALYVPCMAAVATIRQELNSAKWTWFIVMYQIAIAYVTALLVFQLGSLLGL